MASTKQPNLLIILPDQLRASSLPLGGENQIATPHIDRLAAEGCRVDQAVATCPVCTPFRSMMLTGRHPQTTGHVVNFVSTRHDEIGLGDAFAAAGYRTAYVGKWHLHRGSFPQIFGPDYVPAGRDRLGFEYWRGYNFHMDYFDGSINADDWHIEHWQGYETEALPRYLAPVIEADDQRPFCAVISPHPCHVTNHDRFAPERCYEGLPEEPDLPANVPPASRPAAAAAYRHYLAMTRAVDDMVGDILATLERSGRLEDTVVVFCSDHGTAMGSHGCDPWEKKLPYEHSLHVPMLIRWGRRIAPGGRSGALTTPVDLMPSLCALCGVPIPSTVEGLDLSHDWLADGPGRERALTMNFIPSHDHCEDGGEWRGLRTRDHSYARWLDGRVVLYDLAADPLQQHNLADDPAHAALREQLEAGLRAELAERGDDFPPGSAYRDWFDAQRRVVRNAYGPLSHPESAPDFDLLGVSAPVPG